MVSDGNRARLTAARNQLGLSPREMAKRLLTPRSSYDNWESGTRRTPGSAVVAAELLVVLTGTSPVPHHRTKKKRERKKMEPGSTLATIFALTQANWTPIEIAERGQTGLTHDQVLNQIDRLRMLGISVRRYRANKPPRAGTITAEVLKLADGSRTAAEIAETIGTSPRRVQDRLRHLRGRGFKVSVAPGQHGLPAGSAKAKEHMRHARAAKHS